jgi:hypothetical protein
MKKQQVKLIRELADRLPVVYDQTVSGYYEDYDEEGNMKVYPNMVSHEINHVRRMRKAFDKRGMDGVKEYLEMIHKLQLNRNDLYKDSLSEREEVRVADSPEDGGDPDVHSGDIDQHTV